MESTRVLSEHEAEQFVLRHWAFAENVINAKARRLHVRDQDDVRSDGFLALWEAARSYDARKGTSERTHVYRTLNWRSIDLYRNRMGLNHGARAKPMSVPLTDVMAEVIPAQNNEIEQGLTAIAVDQILDALTAQQRELLIAHYLEGRTLTKIAEERGVTLSAVSHALAATLRIARAINLREQ